MKTGYSSKKMVQGNRARSCTPRPAWNTLDRESCAARSGDTLTGQLYTFKHWTDMRQETCIYQLSITFRGSSECHKHSLANTPKPQKSPKKQAKPSLAQSVEDNLLAFHGSSGTGLPGSGWKARMAHLLLCV